MDMSVGLSPSILMIVCVACHLKGKNVCIFNAYAATKLKLFVGLLNTNWFLFTGKIYCLLCLQITYTKLFQNNVVYIKIFQR